MPQAEHDGEHRGEPFFLYLAYTVPHFPLMAPAEDIVRYRGRFKDGWDALQSLRHHPGTQETPIVVCTVLAESQLAYALGATAFLRKPLTRAALLETLGRLAVSRPGPAVGRREPAGGSAAAR